MEIAGNYIFDAPQQLVWEALQDPYVLGSVMPGGKGFEQTGENQYSGTLEVKVGPVQGTFQGQIRLSNVVAPESYHIEVDGKGATGFVKANGQMRLEPREASQTFMAYSGQAQVGGRIASVGQRLIDSAARSIIRQSLEALNEYLKLEAAKLPAVVSTPEPVVSAVYENSTAPVTAAAPTVAAAPKTAEQYKPPSQMSLALNVVRDVFNDMIPAKYRPLFFGAVIVVIGLIIWLIVSR